MRPPMTPTPNYWKFRFLVSQIEATIQRALQAKAQLYAEMELDPAANYTCDDSTETITPQQTTDG